MRSHTEDARVAGLNLPAFVERPTAATRWTTCWPVSPGLISRPSLSGNGQAGLRAVAGLVSPGLISRPSLSDVPLGYHVVLGRGVAGLNLPAFVERTCGAPPTSGPRACRRA